jgi:hypothetical protein
MVDRWGRRKQGGYSHVMKTKQPFKRKFKFRFSAPSSGTLPFTIKKSD